MPTNSTTSSSTKVLLGCSKCGASLPEEAQFCLKCGKPVSSPPKTPAVVEVPAPAEVTPPRRKRRVLLWLLLAILVGVILWAVTSDSTGAQQVQEFVGWKQDRPILDSAFSVGPHTFRYYKFALPEGWVGQVYEWLSEHRPNEIDNRDGQGGCPKEDELRAAFQALNFSKTRNVP